MKTASGCLFFVIALAGLVLFLSSTYTVPETQQTIITQFGKPVGNAITSAGLHFKKPFIQQVNRLEKRILAWDGRPTEMPTKDKTYIVVDAFGRWRISDPIQYFLRIRDERSALSRLDDILGSEIRNAIAKHELIEMIRTTKDRQPVRDEVLAAAHGNLGILYPITMGRAKVEEEVFQQAVPKLLGFGIALLDVRFKRINYNESVRKRIYERMISERQQIADRYRSEGAGEAAKIIGKKERDLQQIQSEAYKKIQKIQGDADAKATEIYSSAYNQSQVAVEFYRFAKSMETYRLMANPDTTLILSTDTELFRFLKSIDPPKR